MLASTADLIAMQLLCFVAITACGRRSVKWLCSLCSRVWNSSIGMFKSAIGLEVARMMIFWY
jgi:hypothetical protein